MLKDLTIAHLTGTATVVRNRFFSDELIFNRSRRTIGQMFCKPYESGKEFIFCARFTLTPFLIIGCCIIDPLLVSVIPAVYITASLGCLLLSGLNACVMRRDSASWWLDMADELFSRLCQAVINLVVLPLTALVLVTRSISTGLKATGLYDYDAPSVSASLSY